MAERVFRIPTVAADGTWFLWRNFLVIPRLRGLLAVVNLSIAEAEQQIAQQQKRIQELRTMGLPTVQEEKTLGAMQVLISAMQDNQLMIERLISDSVEH